MHIYAVLLIILGMISNLLIMCSFSTFTDTKNNECVGGYYDNVKNNKEIQCPHLFAQQDEDIDKTRKIINAFIFIEIILQGITFLDYLIRLLAVESEIVKLNYGIRKLSLNTPKKLKSSSKKNKITANDCFDFLYNILLPIFIRCFFNFRTLYYILSLLFLLFSFVFHPFFNCIILLEFVNRIQLMQAILKAMYEPTKNILITLSLFIILEYFFALFAVSWFAEHFPNSGDTENFSKTFLRMVDQTFKQDGGIGTYLDKSLSPRYVPYSTPSYLNMRLFFDLFFYVITILVILQIFTSIIIDYFNDARENTEKFENNLETQCIICNMEREKIEKINSNDKDAFLKHTSLYHNAFNYIFYLMYLNSSSYRDVIIENNVWELYLNKNYSFMPKNICFKLLEKRRWNKLNQNKIEEEEEEY